MTSVYCTILRVYEIILFSESLLFRKADFDRGWPAVQARLSRGRDDKSCVLYVANVHVAKDGKLIL